MGEYTWIEPKPPVQDYCESCGHEEGEPYVPKGPFFGPQTAWDYAYTTAMNQIYHDLSKKLYGI